MAVVLSPLIGRERATPRRVTAAAIAAAVPDLDAIGRPFGHGDAGWLGGHRADTHSVFFALAIGAVAAFVFRRRDDRWLLAAYFTPAFQPASAPP